MTSTVTVLYKQEYEDIEFLCAYTDEEEAEKWETFLNEYRRDGREYVSTWTIPLDRDLETFPDRELRDRKLDELHERRRREDIRLRFMHVPRRPHGPDRI